jgi:predicted alpha/beta-hydrolase family hydrolase
VRRAACCLHLLRERRRVSKIRGVVLFPGAGSSAEHSSLVAIADQLAPLPVQRVDFAYRAAGRRLPSRAPVLIAEVRRAVLDACVQWSCATQDVVIGGRSMGGRMCSLAVAGFDGNERGLQPAQEPLRVGGLLCVAYPLHPPRQPHKLRVAHLPYVQVPSLFVSGTRDEFATVEELQHHLGAMPVLPTTQFLEGHRHDLRDADTDVAQIVAMWVRRLLK